MNNKNELAVITTKDVEDKLIILRNQKVLLDCDVADLYGVKTKEVNQAVKNNPDKFPYGYIFVLDKYEKAKVVKNFDRLNNLKYSTVEPTAFTQRGLYTQPISKKLGKVCVFPKLFVFLHHDFMN